MDIPILGREFLLVFHYSLRIPSESISSFWKQYGDNCSLDYMALLVKFSLMIQSLIPIIAIVKLFNLIYLIYILGEILWLI